MRWIHCSRCILFCAASLVYAQIGDEASRKTIELDPASEPAHFSLTQSLIAKKDWSGAVAAAESGLAVAPLSARLHLARATSLEQERRIYDARRALESADSIEDLDLLRYRARFEDVYGWDGPRVYRRLAELFEKTAAGELQGVLERGLEVSIRDSDSAQAAWFAAKLQRPAPALKRDAISGVWIPGGFAALAFVARGKTDSGPDEFLTDYARAIVGNGGAGPKPDLAYLTPLRDYFDFLDALLQLGVMREHRCVIPLSVANPAAQTIAGQVLDLLGWTLVRSKDRWRVEAGTKSAQARRQEFASALGIDQVAMESAFSAGKTFDVVIPFEWASIALDEQTWRSQFYAAEQWPGGFAEALARMPQLAPVYAALGAVNRATAAALVSSIGLQDLVTTHGAALGAFSSALVLSEGRVETPGGIAASELWTSLVGVKASNPAEFLRALVDKDDGRLLAFFFTMSQLDLPHQRFFTRNQKRLSRFYDLFRESPEIRVGAGQRVFTESLGPLLREVPLDAVGSVRFPGSPAVWMVAKGPSKSESKTARMLQQAHEAAAPDVEDEILTRLARTQYGVQHTELENFLAVVRIDAHRTQPLDEASALKLAQNYARYSGVYPYFHVLSGLGAREFDQFFKLGQKLQKVPAAALNTILGPFDSLLELIRVAVESRSITEADSTDLFFDLCDRYTRASSVGEYTRVALEMTKRLAGKRITEPTAAIRDLLIPSQPPLSFTLGTPRTADPSGARREAFDRVLHLQNIPPLEAVLEMADAAHAIAAGQPPEPQLKSMDAAAAKLPHVLVVSTDLPDKINAYVDHFHWTSTDAKVNPKDLQKTEMDLLAEMAPTVRVALSGLVYAYYFRPDDLLIADDPLFIRKHRFVDFLDPAKPAQFAPSELRMADDAHQGTAMVGAFGGFATQVARGSVAGAKFEGNAKDIAAAQIAAIRASPWSLYRDADQRLLGLKLRVAREWCVRAASDPRAREQLADATLGMLSMGRRLELLEALAESDWARVRRSLTDADLYFLAGSYLARDPADAWSSPATTALRLAANDKDQRLNVLGPLLSELYGCDHPQLLPVAPYEEFERHVFITPMAERSAEFKIYLAEYLDRRGIAAEAMGVLAEPVALLILSKMTISDVHDWRSILAAYSKLDDDVLAASFSK